MGNIEIWKDVVGYEGYYKVSNLGRVKSLERKEWCVKNNSFSIRKERIIKGGFNKNGYIGVSLSLKGSKIIRRNIHQLVAQSFLNHTPCGFNIVVNHKNHIRDDNRVDNLELVTARENTSYKRLKKTSEFIGVHWSKKINKWKATIHFNSKSIYLGSFDSESEANNYYKNALKSIKTGVDINVKKNIPKSKFKGVSFDKSRNKWVSATKIKGKFKHLGRFNTEIEAHNAYENYKKEIIKSF